MRCSRRALTASPEARGRSSPDRVISTAGLEASRSSPSGTCRAVASAHRVLMVGLPWPSSMPCRVVLLTPPAVARSASEVPAPARSRRTLWPITRAQSSSLSGGPFMRISLLLRVYQCDGIGGSMTVSRLRDIPGIGVDAVGDAADAAGDPELLRLENLDTDIRPPTVALEVTRAAIDDDAANSYLPFQGHRALREAAAAHVGRIAGRAYDPATECVSAAGGLNGILNALLATVEPGQEVVLCDPIYAGLINRVRLAGGVTRFVPTRPGPGGWRVDPGELAD